MEEQEYFSMRACEDSHAWYLALRHKVFEAVRKYSKKDKGIHLLDLGCGTGGQLAFFEKKMPEIQSVGLDPSSLAMRLSYERGLNSRWIQGSGDALPFKEASFDVVLCLDVFYIQGIDDEQGLREAYRVLKTGGLFVVNLPAFEFLKGSHDRRVHTRHRYKKGELKASLMEAGFRVQKSTYWNAILFPLFFFQRTFQRLKTSAPSGSSDLQKLPGWINRILENLFAIERKLSDYFSLPIGTSIFAVAQK